jgi:uncharacterized glyoxalase superfamily protein PhnB
MTTTLFHSLAYADARAAIEFLTQGLGFEVAGVYADPDDDAKVLHAQLDWPGGGGIMFGSAADDQPTGVARAYLVVPTDADVDRLHQQALAHGFTAVREPADMDYGGRGSTVADPERNQWSIGSYPGEVAG